MALSLALADEEATLGLGRTVGIHAPQGLVVRLDGPLGAGKTTFVQGLAQGLEVPANSQVRSPSFALMRIHEGGRLPLVHVDFYRLTEPDELQELGLEEWLGDRAVVAVEWSGRFPDALPTDGLQVDLDYGLRGEGRTASLSWPAQLEPDPWIAALGGGEGEGD